MSVIRIKGLSVSYPDRPRVLEDINLELGQGEYVAVVGPNGAGKTTLFNAMLGLIPPGSGEIEIFGVAPRTARRRVAYMPQRDEVDWSFPLTVMDVALMGRVNHVGWRLFPTPEDRKKAQAALERVGLWDRRGAPVSTLSGGQKQRLLLARALAQDARLLFLDEPFNEVDNPTQELLLALFDELVAGGCTLMVTTHDLELARARFPKALFLNRTVIGFGPVADVFTQDVLQRTYLGKAVQV